MSVVCVTHDLRQLTWLKITLLSCAMVVAYLGNIEVQDSDSHGMRLIASVHAQDVAKATIVIESISKSSATRGKNLLVTYYQDEQCSRRGKTDRVFKKNYVNDVHRFNPLAVEVDVPFIFQVNYVEKRRDEIRRCTAISNVQLQANRSYKAVFNIVEEVIGCNISVYDVTDIAQQALEPSETDNVDALPVAPNPDLELLQVPLKDNKPEYTCSKIGKQGYKSGTPVYSYKDRLG